MGKVITVARQFGSGGRELGRRLAEELGIEYYDNEILSEIAKHTSLAEQYVQSVVERTPHSLMPITIGRSFACVDNYGLRQVQSVYQAQSEIIRELAEKSDCVIIGRCADYILRDSHPVRLFVYAQMDSRIKRCMEREQGADTLSEKEIRRRILDMDKNRAKYYEFYTGNTWGDKLNYDLCINTTDKVIKQLIPAIVKLVNF